MTDKKEFYLPPEVFFDEVLNSKRDDKVSNKLAGMFMMLSEKIANHRYWIRYSHLRSDIISENHYACIRGFDGFEPYQKGHIKQIGHAWNGEEVEYDYKTCNNPHAWFTTCCMNNLKQYMKREYNQSNVINKVKVENGLDASYGYDDMVREQEAEASETKPETSEERVKGLFGIDG